MEEEFQESDILWPDLDRRAATDPQDALPAPGDAHRTAGPTPAVRIGNSPPPARAAARSWSVGFACPAEDEEDGGGSGRVLIPPHLIVGRRIADDGRAAFSVCVGHGRTLKGRDLSHVRNSVLRMTGFLEI